MKERHTTLPVVSLPLSSQALICSSFIPYFCGLIPPSFRGVVSLFLYCVCMAPACTMLGSGIQTQGLVSQL